VVIRVIRVLKSRTKLLHHKSATQGTVIRITNAGNIKEIRTRMELSKNFEPGSIEEKMGHFIGSRKDILIQLLMTGRLLLL
jgi:hypothetical protein